MLHNYVTVYDSNVIISDYELFKLLSVTILIQIIPKILAFHPCYPYSNGCQSFHAMLLGIRLKLCHLTVLASKKVSIKNKIMSASWKQRNICAENNTHHARLITICQEMVTNVKSFTTTVPASHLVSLWQSTLPMEADVARCKATICIKNYYKQLVLLFDACTIVCFPVYCSVITVAPKENERFCIFLTHTMEFCCTSINMTFPFPDKIPITKLTALHSHIKFIWYFTKTIYYKCYFTKISLSSSMLQQQWKNS
jgi:hypothetical protein